MTVERLNTLSLEALYTLAEKMGLGLPPELERVFVIEALIEAYEEDKAEQEAARDAAVRIEENKYTGCELDEIDVSIGAGPCLLYRYNETIVHLIDRDPEWAFVFWDISDDDMAVLRATIKAPGFFLRVYSEACPHEKDLNAFDVPISDKDTHWYLHLPEEDCCYTVELYARLGPKTKLLARSTSIRTPRALMSKSLANFPAESAALISLSGLDALKIISRPEQHPSRILDPFNDN